MLQKKKKEKGERRGVGNETQKAPQSAAEQKGGGKRTRKQSAANLLSLRPFLFVAE